MTKRSNAELLTIEQVIELVCISRAGIYNLMKKGKFPTCYTIGERISRWKSKEIYEYLDTLPKLFENE